MPDLLTVAQVADLLRCAPSTVRQLCREGRLAAVRVRHEWRVYRESLLEVLEPAA